MDSKTELSLAHVARKNIKRKKLKQTPVPLLKLPNVFGFGENRMICLPMCKLYNVTKIDGQSYLVHLAELTHGNNFFTIINANK